MSWHYRARERSDKGQVYWDVVKYYEAHPPYGAGWTANSMAPFGETKEELVAELERMLDDIKIRPVIEEAEEP